MKAAFLDRDGVINKEVNYLHNINDFEYTPRSIDALKVLSNLGFKLIIVTNQAGIAKGFYTEDDYQKLTDWYLHDLKINGIDILDVVHCPHHPNGSIKELSINCLCRKPSPGMILNMASTHDIDLTSSILVGDKLSDVQAADSAGIPLSFLVRSGHQLFADDLEKFNGYVFDDLYDVSKFLLARCKVDL